MLLQTIIVVVSPNQRICKAGSYDPAAILQLHSIAVFDKERNPTYFPKIFEFLTSELKLPENRYVIYLFTILKNIKMSKKNHNHRTSLRKHTYIILTPINPTFIK